MSGWMDQGYRRMWDNGRQTMEHRLMVMAVFGPLPPQAEVHHADLNRSHNENNNFVLCDSKSYHSLLHQRTHAYRTCGHASWRKFTFCQQYDDPVNLYILTNQAWHRHCKRIDHNERQRAYRRRNRVSSTP